MLWVLSKPLFYTHAGIMCPTLSNPENGQVTVNTRTVGSVANYTCNNGFTLNRAEMRTCVQNGVIGQWISGEPTCGELVVTTDSTLHNGWLIPFFRNIAYLLVDTYC